MSRLLIGLGLFALLAMGGCGRENCDKLLKMACDRVAQQEDAAFQCEQLQEQAKSFTDEDCAATLQLLKDSGKLETDER